MCGPARRDGLPRLWRQPHAPAPLRRDAARGGAQGRQLHRGGAGALPPLHRAEPHPRGRGRLRSRLEPGPLPRQAHAHPAGPGRRLHGAPDRRAAHLRPHRGGKHAGPGALRHHGGDARAGRGDLPGRGGQTHRHRQRERGQPAVQDGARGLRGRGGGDPAPRGGVRGLARHHLRPLGRPARHGWVQPGDGDRGLPEARARGRAGRARLGTVPAAGGGGDRALLCAGPFFGRGGGRLLALQPQDHLRRVARRAHGVFARALCRRAGDARPALLRAGGDRGDGPRRARAQHARGHPRHRRRA